MLEVHLVPRGDQLRVGAAAGVVVARERRVEAERDPRVLVLAAVLVLDVLGVLARRRLAVLRVAVVVKDALDALRQGELLDLLVLEVAAERDAHVVLVEGHRRVGVGRALLRVLGRLLVVAHLGGDEGALRVDPGEVGVDLGRRRARDRRRRLDHEVLEERALEEVLHHHLEISGLGGRIGTIGGFGTKSARRLREHRRAQRRKSLHDAARIVQHHDTCTRLHARPQPVEH